MTTYNCTKEYANDLLKAFEIWYRKKYRILRTERIGLLRTEIAWQFFEEINGFIHIQGDKKCRICNSDLKGKRKYYCSEDCRDLGNMFNWQIVKFLFGRFDKSEGCNFCRKKEVELDVDHIKPINSGGMEFDLDNLRYLCVSCNRGRKKGMKFDENNRQLSEVISL